MTRDTAERVRGCLVFNDPCHNDVNISTTVKNISALLTQIQAEATLAEHESHVQFESELYAILVDPVAEGSIKEAEMRKQLLESARWYRQRVYDLESDSQKVRGARLEEAKWFVKELDGRGLCVTHWHHERLAALAQALQLEEKEET